MKATEIRELVKQNGLVSANGVITNGFESAVFLAEVAAQLAELNESVSGLQNAIGIIADCQHAD